jgi:ParB family chromosome partitioning protein
MIPLNQLVENDYNPRKFFDDAAMTELEDSLRQVGLIQPFAVRPSPKKEGKYEVIVGIRRLKGSRKIYGEESAEPMPCHIVDVDDSEAQILSMAENVARANLLYSEEAHAYAHYFGITNFPTSGEVRIPDVRTRKKTDPSALSLEDYAGKIGVGTTVIGKRLLLLKLPEAVQTLVDNKKLSLGQAEALAKFDLDPAVQLQRAQQYVENNNATPEAIESDLNKYMKQQTAQQDKIDSEMEKVEGALTRATEGLGAVVKTFAKVLDEAENVPENIAEASEYLIKRWPEVRDEITGSKKFDQLVEQRAVTQERMDRLLGNLNILKAHPTMDRCPYCGAGIQTDNLQKRVDEAQAEIEACSKRQGEISKYGKAADEAFQKIKSARKVYDGNLKERDNLAEVLRKRGAK